MIPIINVVSSFLCEGFLAVWSENLRVVCLMISVSFGERSGDIARYIYNSSFTCCVACFTSSLASEAILAAVSEATLAKLLAESAAPE